MCCNLRNGMLDLVSCCFAGRAKDLALPTRTIVLRDDLELDAFENDFYVALYTQVRMRVQHDTLRRARSGSRCIYTTAIVLPARERCSRRRALART